MRNQPSAQVIKEVTRRGKTLLVSDGDPLTLKELAEYTGWSSSTIFKFKDEGYAFEYGFRTSAKHFLAWVRDRATQTAEARHQKVLKDQSRRDRAVSRIRSGR